MDGCSFNKMLNELADEVIYNGLSEDEAISRLIRRYSEEYGIEIRNIDGAKIGRLFHTFLAYCRIA